MHSVGHAGVLILAAGLSAPCNEGRDTAGSERPEVASSPSSNPGENALRVVVKRPVPADGVKEVVLPGSVEAWEKAALFARVTGYLDAVAVEIGDQVDKGDEIARVVVPEMTAELRSAEARVKQEQAEHELTQLTRARLEKLRQGNPEAISQQEVDVASAKEHIEAAQVGVAEAERDRLRTLIGYARLRAPFAGRVIKRLLDPGALVREGTASGTQPIVELVRVDKLRLSFEVPEPVAPRARAGTAVELRFDALPGGNIETTIARVSGALDERTRSMRAEVDLDNAEGRYEPGMYAGVTLAAPAIAGALSVPSRAVRGRGRDRFCLIAREGVLHRAPVVVASDDGRTALITKGLSTDDRVMVAGSPLAREGAHCEAIEEAEQ